MVSVCPPFCLLSKSKSIEIKRLSYWFLHCSPGGDPCHLSPWEHTSNDCQVSLWVHSQKPEENLIGRFTSLIPLNGFYLHHTITVLQLFKEDNLLDQVILRFLCQIMEIHCFQCKDGFALYQNESQAHCSAYSVIVYRKIRNCFKLP